MPEVRSVMMSCLAVGRRALSFFVALALMSGLSSLSARPVLAAGALTNLTWAVSSNQAAAAAVNYSFSSTTATAGIIKTITVTISGAGLGGAPAIALNYGIGAGTVAIAGQVITYSVTAAVNIPGGMPILLELSGLTNPGAGGYTSAFASNTAAAATIDSGTTPAVTFAAGNTAKSIVVEGSLAFTLDTTPLTLTIVPTVPPLVYETYTTNITVLTNANSGYTLTVFDNPTGIHRASSSNCTVPKAAASMSGAVAWPGAPASHSGYTVTGTGAGDAGFSVNAAFAGGTRYAGARSAAVIVAQSTTATGATANTIAITDWTAIDCAEQAGTCLDTLSYTLTANFN